tara:strand:+ start:88 stop:501 length:414 start_codon:yes stop_codon:yes gene_type:complete
MQASIKIYKIKSLKHPDTEWQNVEHFFNICSNRQIDLKEKQAGFQQEADEKIKEAGWFNGNFLSNDNKTILKIEICHDRVHKHTKEYWIDPHVNQNEMIIEEIFAKSISERASLQLSKIFKFAEDSYIQWTQGKKQK